MLRVIYVQGISFFSPDAGEIFLFLEVLIFVVLRLFLFLLYLISRRAEQ